MVRARAKQTIKMCIERRAYSQENVRQKQRKSVPTKQNRKKRETEKIKIRKKCIRTREETKRDKATEVSC
jgi:hypothetical protein